ncbi:coiled-coil domain-containing protein 81-like isoform X3 [Gambusia affinis]|uniref:coiled-coil domain-containing protein 81-like isoform X3 n=1 Tax=Gambusia affinis TaxID=33528 RepID=UPI001CDC9C4C|nr:coiled-coil domain-containing protein 81-like isoform X3 [Gambusia affinis]
MTRVLSAPAAHVPVVPLNFAAVSQQTPYSRDVVEGCVRETLAALHRALASERNIFLPFKGIGVLSFRNNKVQMKFSRDFINTISGTHQTLKDSSLRAGSSVSLSSGDVTELQRPQAACHVSLPAIGFSQMDNKGISKEGGNVLPSGDQRNKKEVPQQRESKSNQSLQMKAVGLTEELNPIPPAEPSSSVLHEEPPKLDQHLRNVSCSGQILAEQAKLTERREQAKKVAAFNLLMSRQEKSSCFDCPRSFIFPARPVTPPKRIQQHRYRSDLRSQMERRQQLEAQDQQYRLLTERLDQMQLIQEWRTRLSHRVQSVRLTNQDQIAAKQQLGGQRTEREHKSSFMRTSALPLRERGRRSRIINYSWKKKRKC